MAAAIEQRHDELGIAWPESIAPYDVHLVALPGAEEIAERAAAALEAGGRTVLLDDRDQRAGEKFADADLIGCPMRVTAGKKSLEDGGVDVRDRSTGDERRVRVEDLCWRGRVDATVAAFQRRAVRPDDPAADGRPRPDVSRARREDRALGGVSEPPRAREPAGSLGRRDRDAGQGARCGARPLPGSPHPPHCGAPGAHAEADRPALSAAALTAADSEAPDTTHPRRSVVQPDGPARVRRFLEWLQPRAAYDTTQRTPGLDGPGHRSGERRVSSR